MQIYKYFHINHPADLTLQFIQLDMLDANILLSSHASITLVYIFNNFKSLLNFHIFFHTVPFLIELGLFVKKWWFLCHNNLCKCAWFSLAVHHSKFSTRLSVLTQFIWLTWGLFSWFRIKWFATMRWIVKLTAVPLLHNLTNAYQWVLILILRNFHLFFQKTSQFLVTEYNHSYQIISIIYKNNPLIPVGSSSNSTYKNQWNIKRRRIKLFDFPKYTKNSFIYN